MKKLLKGNWLIRARVRCKHIWAVEFSATLRRQVEVRRIEPVVSVSHCVYCGSLDIVKDGVRRNKYGDIQKFHCRDCGRYFSFNIGFEKMKHSPRAVTMAMQLYFSGESLRNTKRSLRLLGVKVSHQTVYNWIKKYVGLMGNYLESITPDVGDTWRADELWLKIKGDKKYLFALMDDETRFWIAQEVANLKYKHDARNVFRSGKTVAGKMSRRIITNEIASTINARNGGRQEGEKLSYKQLFNFHYADGRKMLTVGGLLHDESQSDLVAKCGFKDFDFIKDGEEAYEIDVPNLTLREIHYLNKQLPSQDISSIEAFKIPLEDIIKYAKIYRYFPLFVAAEIG